MTDREMQLEAENQRIREELAWHQRETVRLREALKRTLHQIQESLAHDRTTRTS